MSDIKVNITCKFPGALGVRGKYKPSAVLFWFPKALTGQYFCKWITHRLLFISLFKYVFTSYWSCMDWKLNMHLRALAELGCLKELWFLNEMWQGLICMYPNSKNWNLVFKFLPKASRILANLSCALDVKNLGLYSILVLLRSLKIWILKLWNTQIITKAYFKCISLQGVAVIFSCSDIYPAALFTGSISFFAAFYIFYLF